MIENIEHGFNGKDYKPLKQVTIVSCGEIKDDENKITKAIYLSENQDELLSDFMKVEKTKLN